MSNDIDKLKNNNLLVMPPFLTNFISIVLQNLVVGNLDLTNFVLFSIFNYRLAFRLGECTVQYGN